MVSRQANQGQPRRQVGSAGGEWLRLTDSVMKSDAFVKELERLAGTRAAAEVVAFYERYGPAIQPLLRGNDRLSVAAIMEVADTVVEYAAISAPIEAAAAPSSSARPPGRDPRIRMPS